MRHKRLKHWKWWKIEAQYLKDCRQIFRKFSSHKTIFTYFSIAFFSFHLLHFLFGMHIPINSYTCVYMDSVLSSRSCKLPLHDPSFFHSDFIWQPKKSQFFSYRLLHKLGSPRLTRHSILSSFANAAKEKNHRTHNDDTYWQWKKGAERGKYDAF